MMEQLAAHDVDSARRASAVSRIVFLTLGGALLLGVGLVAALMVFNAQVLDSRAQHASVDAMREGLDERARQLDRVVETYAWWNEAVEAIQSRQDRGWAAVNLGSDLYHTYPYDWAFVIAPDGSTFHAALEGNPVADDISTALGNDLWRPLVEQSRGVVVDGGLRAVHAYTPMREGRLGIISAAAIMPEDGPTRARPAGAPYVLVLVRGLTSDWLAELTGALGLSELSLQPVAPKAHERPAARGTRRDAHRQSVLAGTPTRDRIPYRHCSEFRCGAGPTARVHVVSVAGAAGRIAIGVADCRSGRLERGIAPAAAAHVLLPFAPTVIETIPFAPSRCVSVRITSGAIPRR